MNINPKVVEAVEKFDFTNISVFNPNGDAWLYWHGVDRERFLDWDWKWVRKLRLDQGGFVLCWEPL